MYHDDRLTGGHSSIYKTLDKMKKYSWDRMTDMVKFVRSCDTGHMVKEISTKVIEVPTSFTGD